MKKSGKINLRRFVDICKFLVLSGIIVWFLSYTSSNLGYNWQWYRIPKYLFIFKDGHFHPGPLIEGLMITLQISAISLVASFIIGLVTALFRLSRSFAARAVAKIYLEFIRNTPLLVQLFLMYFVISPILNLSPFVSAVLTLSFFEGSYASEIIRAGIVSIHKGQWESAYSLGLNRIDTYIHIIFPQTLRNTLPTLASQAISLVKDSALVSTIAIFDLTMHGQAIVSQTFLAFEIWFTVAAIYLIITFVISVAVHRLEYLMKKPY